MSWQRARSREQKEIRIQSIVDATGALYASHPFEQITFGMIADKAGITRTNLYRYFKNTEEIFLELLKNDIHAWKNDITAEIRKHSWTVETFSTFMVDALEKRVRMLRFFSIMNTVLEKNASLEKLTLFKQALLDDVVELSNLLTEALPFETREKAVYFLTAQWAVLSGFFPMWDLSDRQKQAMDTVGMESSPRYYRALCIRSIEAILRVFTRP